MAIEIKQGKRKRTLEDGNVSADQLNDMGFLVPGMCLRGLSTGPDRVIIDEDIYKVGGSAKKVVLIPEHYIPGTLNEGFDNGAVGAVLCRKGSYVSFPTDEGEISFTLKK
jgi:hypothetical protein